MSGMRRSHARALNQQSLSAVVDNNEMDFSWRCDEHRIKLESVSKPSVMVALRCFTDAELLWQHAKIWLPWQQGSIRVVFEWYRYIARSLKPRLWYKNLALISYTSRVIANFMCKHPNFCYSHILLTAILPYCKSRLLTSLLNIASERHCLASGEGTVTLAVTLSRCVCVCPPSRVCTPQLVLAAKVMCCICSL